jgi:hypothetical protein
VAILTLASKGEGFYLLSKEAKVSKEPWAVLITNNQQNTAVNFHQGFVASTHSDYSQGQVDRGLLY